MTTESIIANRIEILKLSQRCIAHVTDVEPSRLSRALSGVQPLSPDEAGRLLRATATLLALSEGLRPLRLPANAEELRGLLIHIEDAGIDPDFIRQKVSGLFRPEAA